MVLFEVNKFKIKIKTINGRLNFIEDGDITFIINKNLDHT